MDGEQTGSEGPYCQCQMLSDAVHSCTVLSRSFLPPDLF